MTISYVSAVSTENFINSIGINTHLDFSAYSSQLTTVIADLQYIGVKNIRDSANSSTDLGTTGSWQQVANATGAKFDAYLGEGSVATMESGLANAVTLAKQGILNFIEGGNEEDQSYATSLGNSLAKTAAYQQTVYTTAHALGISVINMSFGTGWGTSSTGDYGTVGNLASYADYANAHTYFGTGNTPLSTIDTLNSDAQLAAVGKPVITTEMGWYTTGSTTDASAVSVTEQAKYMMDGLLDAYQAGDAKTYLYELLDEGTSATNTEDNFGLFYANGTAKPAAIALHNMTTLLADSGSTASSFTATGLSYQLTGTLSTDHSMLMQKSDGSFWLAVWNEARLSGPTSPAAVTVANHTVTLTLGSAASTIEIFDPLTGTTATQTVTNASTVTLSVPDHPILVEIIPGTSTGTGSTGTTTTAPTASDLAVIIPTYDTAYTSQITKLAGVSISDAWGGAHAGSMVLNLTAGHDALEMSNGSSVQTVAAGKTLTVTGTLAQLNADLATLDYVGGASASTDSITVDVWNQGGVESTKTLIVDLVAATSTSTSSSGSTTTPLSASDLAVTVPITSPSVHTTAYSSITGVSISDAWAAGHSGSMALNLSVLHGTIEISNGTSTVSGAAVHLTGTLAQLNADLQTLHYEATALVGIDTLSVNVWNQGGVSVTHALALTIS
jgi:hypothetical protein